MIEHGPPRRILRFDIFQCDLYTGELRKGQTKVRLSDQPFRLLGILLERPGDLVTRQELRERLWSTQNFGDFDDGLNTAINKIRLALDDKPENPRFIETIPRRGYRFIAPVEVLPAPPPPPADNREPQSALPPPLTNGPGAAVSPPKSQHGAPLALRRLTQIASVLAAPAVLFLLWWFTPLPPPRVLRIDQVTTSARIDLPVKPVSADGRVFYLQRSGNQWNLMQTWIGDGDGRPVPWPGDDPVVLDIAPDGSKLLIAGSARQGSSTELWIAPSDGGGPVSLGVPGVGFAAFSPHGRRIAFLRGNELGIMDVNGANGRNIALLPHDASWLAWSPDGRLLRFTLGPLLSGLPTSLWEISSHGTNLHPLLPGWSHPDSECCGSWTPDGRYYIFTSSRAGHPDLWALRERGSFWRRSPRGPFQLTFGPDAPWGGTPSRDGRHVFYYNGIWSQNMQRLDLKTSQFSPFRPGGRSIVAAFTRDGRWIAYNGPPDGALFRSRADGTDPVELAPASMNPSFPRWSPDGKWIAFGAQLPNQPAEAYVVSSSGGKPLPLFPTARDVRDADWSSGGKRLVVASAAGPQNPGGSELLLVDFATRRTHKILGSKNLAMCRWSPDGHYISATSDSRTQLKLWDSSAPAANNWRVIARGLGFGIGVWSPDSRYLYFQDLRATGEPLFRYDVRQERVEPVADFSEFLKSGVGRCALFGVTPDGSPVIAFSRSFDDLFAAKLALP